MENVNISICFQTTGLVNMKARGITEKAHIKYLPSKIKSMLREFHLLFHATEPFPFKKSLQNVKQYRHNNTTFDYCETDNMTHLDDV